MAIIDVLPGGGSSMYYQGFTLLVHYLAYLTKKGTLNNTLLAQTITLGLNIGINGALGDFALQAGKLRQQLQKVVVDLISLKHALVILTEQ